MNASRCVLCHKIITWRFYLCANCEKQYKKPYPEWLRLLINDTMKRRVALQRRTVYEVEYCDDPGDNYYDDG